VVAVFEKTDTIPVAFLYKKGRKVKYENGYAVRQGFKAERMKGMLDWVQQPKLIGILDRRKRKAENVIQIL
jgi:hypothetical protein